MAERKAQNKWIPPNFDPQKHKSINGFHKSNPLRARARLMHEGIVIIRFEMPFNVWCLHCNSHIGAGVRYNSQKKRIGYYLSTPIFEFRMKCHVCSGWIGMKTDPQNTTYICTEGLRKKVEEYEPGPETGQIVLNTEVEKEKLENDAFYRLEHEVKDKEKAQEVATSLEQLYDLNNRHWKDPYEQSRKLRNMFRADKKERKVEESMTKALQDKYSLNVELSDLQDGDSLAVHAVEFDAEDYASREVAVKQAQLESSIFANHDIGGSSKTDLFNSEVRRRKVADELSHAPQRSALIKKKSDKPATTIPTQQPKTALLLEEYSDSD